MARPETGNDGTSGGPRYRFGAVVVDAAAHTLVRAGQAQTVEPKAFAVLLALLRRAGEMVPRDELLDEVWGHRHVTPGVLTRAIAQLRHALDDDFHHPRYIHTQHALGYRFIAVLEADSGPAATVAAGAATTERPPPGQSGPGRAWDRPDGVGADRAVPEAAAVSVRVTETSAAASASPADDRPGPAEPSPGESALPAPDLAQWRNGQPGMAPDGAERGLAAPGPGDPLRAGTSVASPGTDLAGGPISGGLLSDGLLSNGLLSDGLVSDGLRSDTTPPASALESGLRADNDAAAPAAPADAPWGVGSQAARDTSAGGVDAADVPATPMTAGLAVAAVSEVASGETAAAALAATAGAPSPPGARLAGGFTASSGAAAGPAAVGTARRPPPSTSGAAATGDHRPRPAGVGRPARWGLAALLLLALAAAGWWLWRDGALLPRAGLGPPGTASIAVLPFTSLSSARDDRYFAEGLAVEMHDALAGVPGLQVVAGRPGEPGLGDRGDIQTLGKRLGVATVLDASVRRDGPRMRISARLADTRTGVTLWAGSYDRQTADVFALQTEIANEVVQALLGVLPGGGRSMARRLAPTHSIVAYDAYLKGVQRLQDAGNDQALQVAIGHFRQALSADPVFARAQAGICRAEIARFESTRDAAAFERAETACMRASSMDPALREVSLALGEMYRARGDHDKAIAQYTRALDDIALRPAAYVGLARAQGALGRNELALDYFERARQLQPGDASILRERGYHQYLAGDVAAAIASYRDATALAPDDAGLWSSLGGLYLAAGDGARAGEAFERSLAIEPNYAALSNYGSLRYEAGDYAEAAALYRRAADLDPTDFRIWGNIGDALAAMPATAHQAREPYRRAAQMAERYVGIKGDDAQALALLCWYRANLGEPGAARELLQRAESMATEPGEVAFWGAQALALLGDSEGARLRVQRAQAADIPLQRLRASPLLRRVLQATRVDGAPHAGGIAGLASGSIGRSESRRPRDGRPAPIPPAPGVARRKV